VSSATIVRIDDADVLPHRRHDELIADRIPEQDALAVHEPRVAVEAIAVSADTDANLKRARWRAQCELPDQCSYQARAEGTESAACRRNGPHHAPFRPAQQPLDDWPCPSCRPGQRGKRHSAKRSGGNNLCQRCAEHETAVRNPARVAHWCGHQEITNRKNLLESTPSRRVVAKPIRTAGIGTKKRRT
jgi:hypothetical protein